jgi:hypothetical protein
MLLRRLMPCVLLVIGCGGNHLSTSSSTDMTVYGVKAGPPPTDHRPVATACKPTDAGTSVCATDSDCPSAMEACGCDDTGGACVQALCHVDSDCGAGGYCSPSYDLLVVGCNSNNTPTASREILGFYCHTAADDCNNDSDCMQGQTCGWVSYLGRWSCVVSACSG